MKPIEHLDTNSMTYEDIDSALGSEVFINRESGKIHTRYQHELVFYTLIKNGDINGISNALEVLASDTIGRMSKNPLRQQMYEFVASITLVTRFSIEGGLLEEDAYHLSDIYIQKADACTNASEIWTLLKHMIMDFTTKVNDLPKNQPISSPISQVMDYIFNHLHDKITLKELAGVIGFQNTYLCYLFKKETGSTITDFIQEKRVAEAQSLLRYSEYTPVEISQYLGFCSQSHFNAVFKKYTQMTPLQYRKTYFRRNWSSL
ncbi:MAG: putative transcriptional regulator [Anaerocolumna sp.]|jgi:AraC-like DNA-binding protein|nr:putative transcriptional regulator [Anaerocolumna sp.]